MLMILALKLAFTLIAYVVASLYIDYKREKMLQIKKEKERLKRVALQIKLKKDLDDIDWW